MYNAFKHKKTLKEQETEKARIKPLKERDPDLFAKRTNRMSNNAKFRRLSLIGNLTLREDKNSSV